METLFTSLTHTNNFKSLNDNFGNLQVLWWETI